MDEKAARAIVQGQSIALVGNATSILDTDLGEAIDAHDHVCRLNRGIPSNPQQHWSVGRRTTLYVGQCPPQAHKFAIKFVPGSHPKRSYAEIQDFAVPEGVELAVGFCYGTMRDVRLDPTLEKAWWIPPERIKALEDELGSRPTTGLVAAHMLMSWGPSRIDLYGFDFLSSGSWPYPGQVRDPDVSPHDSENEERWFRERFEDSGSGWRVWAPSRPPAPR